MIPHTNVRSFGSGPRRALAIHCTLAHSGAWRGLGEIMADELTLVAMDMACHGKSGDWDRTGNLHDVVTDMARSVMDDAPMDLIGHSFGATVALRLAVENPERVRSVTMIEPVYFAALIHDDPHQGTLYAQNHAPFAEAFATGDMMEAARVFNRDWGDGTKWENVPQKAREYMAARIHFVTGSSAFLRDDSAGLMRPGMFDRAAMPGLLIDADQSPPVSGLINDSLARRLPNTARVTVQGAGHMVPITHPKLVAEPLRALLEMA